MKFRVLSDLYVNSYSHPVVLQRKLNKLIPHVDNDEILLIAGNLGVAGPGFVKSLDHSYRSMLEYFAHRWNYVILIPGNLEYLNKSRFCKNEHVDNVIQKGCDEYGIAYLNKETLKVDLGGNYTILACTLWDKNFPKRYEEDCLWLETELSKKKKKKEIILITSYSPFLNQGENIYSLPYFVQQNTEKIRYWIYGNSEKSIVMNSDTIDFCSNPFGTRGRLKSTNPNLNINEI
jgi:hypothetical protein